MISTPTISVVIVNYRTANLTLQCLESLSLEYSNQYPFSVAVADNNSGDGSAKFLAGEIVTRGWSSWATVLPLERNGGFAYGNNRVIEKIFRDSVNCKYIWLLNPDTIVHRNACHELVEFMERHPRAGICGSLLEGPEGQPVCSAFRFHSLLSELLAGAKIGLLDKILKNHVVPLPNCQVPHQADWLPGASLLIRREVFEEVGLLDESYFMYFEEVDYCLQAKRKGWECWHGPESRVVHLEGAASGFSQNKRYTKVPDCWFVSRRKFFMKNYGVVYSAFADLAWFLGNIIFAIRNVLFPKRSGYPLFTAKEFLRFSILGSWINNGKRKD